MVITTLEGVPYTACVRHGCRVRRTPERSRSIVMLRHAVLLVAVSVALTLLPVAAQSPTPGPAAAQSPTVSANFSGWLNRAGHRFNVGPPTVVVKGTHCHEPQEPFVTITFYRAPDKPDGGLTDPVLSIGADLTRVRLAIPLLPETALDRETGAHENPPARIMAWASPVMRGASATLPQMATVTYHALSRTGPVDVSFDADFGGMGHVKGRVALDHTDEIVCVSPRR